MIAALTRGILAQRVVVLALVAMAVAWGAMISPFGQAPVPGVASVHVDAIPDIGENQQIVFTEWPGRSPRDIDDQVTYPLTAVLLSAPGVVTVRSFSMMGASSIYVVFDEDMPYYDSRERLLELLASLPRDLLPRDVTSRLGPDATALGQVFWYTLEGRDEHGNPTGGWDEWELRALQDFHVSTALGAAPGVAEVASVGGAPRELHVEVDPAALRYHHVTLLEVVRAVRDAHAEVGARTTEMNGVEYFVRGVGFVESVEDVEQALVRNVDGVPVRVVDVARVGEGPGLRRGALDRDGAPAVGGVVVARYGENPREVIAGVHEQIERIAPSLPSRVLPDGTVSHVTIVPFYDRTPLIEATVGTLRDALWQQILVTVLVVLVMMLHLRSAALVSVLLPAAVSVAFVAMWSAGVTANVVSLAGIAIAIGTMVDLGIVVTENIVQRLREAADSARTPRDRLAVIADATGEVGGAVLTAVATTVISFLPVFLLEGAECRLFGPLAFTKTWALVASVALALVAIPALASLVLLAPSRPRWARVTRPASLALQLVIIAVVGWWLAQEWTPLGVAAGTGRNLLFVAIIVGGVLGLFRGFAAAYPSLLRWVLAHRAVFALLPVTIVVFGLTAWLGFGRTFGWLPDTVHRSELGQWLHHEMPGLGREFMPQLDEGAFLYMPSTMPHASLGEAQAMMSQIDARIAAIPEVQWAVGKLGRAETALDPAPVSMFETIITYAPEYLQDDRGRRLRFAVDAEGGFVRDEQGQLVPDDDGEPFRVWRDHIRSPDDIWDEIVAAAQVPGVTSAPMLQPISTRIVMLQSGIRAPVAVQLQGADLDQLGEASLAVEALLRDVPQVAQGTVNADRPVGKPYLELHPDREVMARYGVTMAALQAHIEAAIGGVTVAQTIEGRERYDVRVRYPRELRDTPEAIDDILVATEHGAQIPLGMLAQIRYVRGPQMIRSEDAYLTTYVMFGPAPGVAEVDAAMAVRSVLQAAIDEGRLVLPDGVTWNLAGTWEQAERARARLAVIVPLVLLSIAMLLYAQFRSPVLTLAIFAGVAVALAGGMGMIWLCGRPGFLDVELLGGNLREVFQLGTVHLSVAVWVGFIALFGIATDDGVVMATYLRDVFAASPVRDVHDVHERVMVAGTRRVLPCLMTTATTLLALLPVLTSTGTGADVMIPMALPAIGGMTVALITLFVVPAVVFTLETWRLQLRRDPGPGAAEVADEHEATRSRPTAPAPDPRDDQEST